MRPQAAIMVFICGVLCIWCETEVQEVFDLFDFWDGRDSMVDGVKVGDFLRCCGLNPTQALVLSNGGTANVGTCWNCIVIDGSIQYDICQALERLAQHEIN